MTEPTPPTPDAPRVAYREGQERAEGLRDAARAASLGVSRLRVGTFLGAAAAFLVADVTVDVVRLAAVAVAAMLAVAFVVLVARHRRLRREELWHEALRGLACQGLQRLDRRWDELAQSLPPGEGRGAAPSAEHAYARDLDLEGHASLVRLMGPVTTAFGRRTLRAWLMEACAPEEARARSGAARELAPMLGERHVLAAHGRLAGSSDEASLEVFLRWAEGEPWVLRHGWLRAAAVVSPVALVATVLLHLLGGVPLLWVLPALTQGVLLKKHMKHLSEDFHRVVFMGPALAAYVPQLEALAGWPMEAPALSALAERLGGGASPEARPARARPRASRPAHVRLGGLVRLVDTVESRRNMVYATLAPILMLDVHLAHRLDRWRDENGACVRDWLEALGELEAVAALASLAHDHPDWVYPSWAEGGEARLEATALGHPLLPPGTCVRNDVTVGPPGTFLLVTGSNMSGKSTLLRAIGANVVLAGAGAPVCAAALALTPVRVHTSMRIEDSLSEGISLFMAELLRVRDIVRAAEEEGPPVLYLLDEMLHGTNTAERRIAARAVVRHLVEHGAIGAVSTHDLTLAEAPDLVPHAHSVHFREEVERVDGRTRLSFDYRLRPGTATTRNALRLLEAVGLDWDLPEEG